MCVSNENDPYTGPNLIEKIPDLLLAFRIGQFATVSDIRRAFLQIEIAECVRDVLRFLWWKDYSTRTKMIYRHRRVVFGVATSPFLLAATINYHLDRVSPKFVSTAQRLKSSFYVDNCITSFELEDQRTTFIEEAKSIMMDGQFDLRGWVSNIR